MTVETDVAHCQRKRCGCCGGIAAKEPFLIKAVVVLRFHREGWLCSPAPVPSLDRNDSPGLRYRADPLLGLVSLRIGQPAPPPHVRSVGRQEVRGAVYHPLTDLPLPGRLVSAVDLPRLLSNIANLLHREEARQLDVQYGAG